MRNRENILISLENRHAENIFSGQKQVELRRRRMRIAPGTIAWVYVKLPVGSLVGRVTIGAVHTSAPSTLWRRFGSLSGLTRKEFLEYFYGVTDGFVFVLENAQRLRSSLSLNRLRELEDGFSPPQFFLRLRSQHPFLGALTG